MSKTNLSFSISITSILALVAVLIAPIVANAATGYAGDTSQGGYTGGGSSGSYNSSISNPLLVDPTVSRQSPGGPSFVFVKDVQKGQTSTAVVELQERLRKAGFFTYPVSTGFFGPITFEAVKKFQKAHPEIGRVTGYVGPLTRAVLNK